MINSIDNQKESINQVGISGYEPIETRFMTLINAKCEAPFDWYKELGLDKSDASKIRRGLLIPPEWLRIKIAHYFGVDSSTIWKVSDLPYIKQLLKNKRGEARDYESLPPNTDLNLGEQNGID